MWVILSTLSRRVFDFASKSITLAPVFPLPGRYSSMVVSRLVNAVVACRVGKLRELPVPEKREH